MRLKLTTRAKRIVLSVIAVLLIAYVATGALIWRAMNQPPEQFGHFMARLPGPVPFLLFPFETFWMRARAGHLNLGDSAPDFSLAKVDKSATVHLAEMNQNQPVVLVFGSYT